MSKLRFFQENCNPELANDRSLPYTSYLVEYISDGETCYDIVIANKQTDIFDHYWDRYREDLLSFKQTEGRVNPKLWEDPRSKGKKK